jgi:hypothetical protein
MTLEEHTNLIRDIKENRNDEGKISTLLMQLSEDYTATKATEKATTETITKLEEDKESLRQSNMELFLRVGTPVKDQPQQPPQTEKKSFDTLFNDKGGLK